MAIVELTEAAVSSAADHDEATEAVDARLDVHDASRLEWSVTLPIGERGRRAYAIELEIEVPANVFARHSPWEKLQSWTRLDGPADVVEPGERVTIDTLRRATISFAHKLARAGEGFARHCRLAGALCSMGRREELEEGLALWIGVATSTAADARARLVPAAVGQSAEIRRERELIDEYVSVRLLEMLANAERAIVSLASSPNAGAYATTTAQGGRLIADALAAEVEHRRSRGYLCADPESTATLEQYLDRASRLKKHFQEVLFLEPETFHVAERLHHWVASFVALVAATWAFAWQLWLARRAPTTGSAVGSGLVVLAVVGGLVYAAKDRIKEVGRSWISGNVHRFYAQRVARWRAPAKRLSRREVVVSARESFDQAVRRQPDPLNPESGASLAATLIRFTHRGHVIAHPALHADGVRRVKHIFRYDLSPLFGRLDDAVKKVPVLDAGTQRVCFADAPRVYRVPVALRVTSAGDARDLRATLVIHKRGLDRIESDDEGELDTGVLPL
jgi:hypothetical protein